MFTYPVDLDRAEDGVTITFPDLPYGVTCGDDEEEALAQASMRWKPC